MNYDEPVLQYILSIDQVVVFLCIFLSFFVVGGGGGGVRSCLMRSLLI